LTTNSIDGIVSNMKATLLIAERQALEDGSFAELRIWKLPRMLPGSAHDLKYRLAYVVNDVCVLRYDNEAGKGDHRHIGESEAPYHYVSLEQLLNDFWLDVSQWRPL
jgi:Family of unknown function (DUF6516)